MLARDARPGQSADSAAAAAALQRTLARVGEQLGDALGADGRNALLARALSQTEKEHPALRKIRRIDNDTIQLEGVVTTVEADGVAAVTAAIEALLAAVIEVLSRLIGEDMAIRLIDHEDATSEARGDASSS